MHIRKMNVEEYPAVIALIHETVHCVCANDYSQNELYAWAPEKFDTVKFCEALSESYNLVALSESRIVGFASMDSSGYLSRLFTHKDYQRCGIGSELLNLMELHALNMGHNCISLDSSKTAEGFYSHMGYKKTGISVARRNGVVFRNTVMRKQLMKGANQDGKAGQRLG